jgi:hypothetical protein
MKLAFATMIPAAEPSCASRSIISSDTSWKLLRAEHGLDPRLRNPNKSNITTRRGMTCPAEAIYRTLRT